jgi:hypothetical protein
VTGDRIRAKSEDKYFLLNLVHFETRSSAGILPATTPREQDAPTTFTAATTPREQDAPTTFTAATTPREQDAPTTFTAVFDQTHYKNKSYNEV